MKITKLEWDDANVEHISRHGVHPEEVEDACAEPHLVFAGQAGRYILFGKT